MLKKIVAMITTFAVVIAGMNFSTGRVDAAVNSADGSSSWTLVWNDEFNQTVGGAPDTSVWNYDIGTGPNGDGWGNQERQVYTNSTDNVYIADMSSDSQSSDGRCLAIKAQREGDQITSGRLHSQNKVYAKYGKIEAKLKVEKGQQSGVWPAFWMLGENYVTSGSNWNGANGDSPWPSSGEIDIMEHRNEETSVIGTLHWNPSTTAMGHTYAGSETTGKYGSIGSIEEWHKYSVEWYGDVMKWYVDDVCYQTMDITSSEMDEFQRSHFILLNLAIGSTSTPFTKNQTVSDSFTDATMYVDYVRIYQGSDSGFYISSNNVQETSAEPTTTGDGLTACSSEKTSLGGWGYYVLGGNAARYAGGATLSDEFTLKVTSNNKAAWNVQAFTQNISVTSGHTYHVSVDINSSAASDAILMKDEIGGTEFENKALIAGDNTFTGTFTASSDTMQLMFNLGGINSGTTLKFSNVVITDITGSEGTETTTASSTTGSEEWVAIENGNNIFFYDKANMKNISGVVNIQQPGFASEQGIYMTVPNGISSISVNGNTENVGAIQGAGAVIYLSALTQQMNTVILNQAGTTSTITIKNINGSGSTEQETTTEAVQEETTTKTTQEETTTESTSEGNVTVSKDIQLLGYQISTSYEGIRVAAGVEPTINGQAVKSWGFVYGLVDYKNQETGITDADMIVGVDNTFIKSYVSTSAGTLNAQLGTSSTATYYARTMKFGAATNTAFTANYKVRAYAVLEDGSYVYSNISEYSIVKVADMLYQNKLMNTISAHNYLYEKILSKVYAEYGEVDFQWNNSVVKPEQVEE